MRGKPNPELREECLRLRKEERMSYKEISEVTGASKGSLSPWLRDYPLTEEELAKREQHRLTIPRARKDRPSGSKWAGLVDEQKMSRLQKGKLAEAAVLFRLVLHGWAVYGSMFDGDLIDWIAVNTETGKVCKIQIKWAKQDKSGLPLVSLRHTSGYNDIVRYAPGDFDLLVGYCFQNDTCYVWTEEEVSHLKSAVTIHEEAAERRDKLL
ncbi:hypothetical protein LCGC14_0909160 [marine sediment metagenome]|uniref:PD(D/E)XK endonuclease domain-containing protein n=1 Tax=marine sediment metagenome TaxID=412755 RepID=A0A0F9S0V9_9ZZZZ